MGALSSALRASACFTYAVANSWGSGRSTRIRRSRMILRTLFGWRCGILISFVPSQVFMEVTESPRVESNHSATIAGEGPLSLVTNFGSSCGPHRICQLPETSRSGRRSHVFPCARALFGRLSGWVTLVLEPFPGFPGSWFGPRVRQPVFVCVSILAGFSYLVKSGVSGSWGRSPRLELWFYLST